MRYGISCYIGPQYNATQMFPQTSIGTMFFIITIQKSEIRKRLFDDITIADMELT